MKTYNVALTVTTIQRKSVVADSEENAIAIADSEDWHEKEEVLSSDMKVEPEGDETPVPPQPPKVKQTGAATICIQLHDGNITVMHGVDGDVLHKAKNVVEGSWSQIWETIRKLETL